MIPAVEHGDVLTIGPIDSRSIAPGDIVLLRHRGRPIAHRVEEICPGDDGGTVVIARGDGKAGADAPVGLHDVLGKVVSIDKRARASDRGVALIIPDAVMRLLRRFLRPPAGSRSLELALERARPQS